MLPAHQRLEPGDGAVLEPDDRLIEERDFAPLERAPQLGLDREAVALARAHRRLEHLDAISADALGVVHREFRVLEHFVALARLPVGEHESDRGGEQDFPVVEGDRRP